MRVIEASDVRRLLSYDPDTGELCWRERPDNPSFNLRWAGKPAFTANCPLGYRVGRLLYKSVKAHRVAFAIMKGRWPVGDIDHINGNPGDNRWCNLRECTRAENQRNLPCRNPTGFKGIVRRTSGNWSARINAGRKCTHLGTFPTARDAAIAYDAAARRIHGAFARLNFPQGGEG